MIMDDDFDIEMDRYLAMSPAEQAAEDVRIEAEIENRIREREAWLDRLPLGQRVAYFRDSWLRNIRENRRRLRDPELCRIPFIKEMWHDHIRGAQLALVKLRIWRATGTYPGEA
jgi:hypothetical protein